MELVQHYIENLGFGLVSIPKGSKAPKSQGWQNEPIQTYEAAQTLWARDGNIGLHHAASRTAVLDLDNMEYAQIALEGVGISLNELLNADGAKIQTLKGLKPLYRLPSELNLSRKALSWKLETGNSTSVFELRGGATQDLLPPSLHPSGHRYSWQSGLPASREEIAKLPDSLRSLWMNWEALKPTLERASPWASPPPPRKWQGKGESVIATYNAAVDLREVLERNGYMQRGDRFLAPSSSTDTPGVTILQGEDGVERAYSHHGSDPLASDHCHDSFSAYCFLEHDGDVKTAVRAAAETLGIAREPKVRPDVERPQADERQQRKSQASELVELVKQSNAELFYSPDKKPHITASVGEHFETYHLRGRPAEFWLRRLYHEATGRSIANQALGDALNDLESTAIFDGQMREVYRRVAPCGDDIIVDLGDSYHQVVRVTSAGWHLEAHSPVKFVRSNAQAPLPVPLSGGSLGELWTLLNVKEEDRVLLAAWLAKSLTPSGPYPLLPLHGEQGSAKSTTARAIRALIDPNTAPLRRAPHNPQDLMIAASTSWLPTFDNLSSVSQDLSDALCILSTGGGYAARKLYRDDEETILSAQRPVIMTAISDIATRSDLLDRSLILYLPRITDTQRKSEQEFWAIFNQAHGRIFGALLTAVSAGLARLPHVNLEEKPRMADFAIWAVACEEALGFDAGSFMARYNEVRRDANEMALDTSPLPSVLRAFTEHNNGSWQGTASELLNASNDYLKSIEDERTPRAREWPKRADKLAGSLRRYAPNLRATGLEVEFERTSSQRLIRLRTTQRTSVTGVTGVTVNRETRQARQTVDDAPQNIGVTRQPSVTLQSTSDTVQSPPDDANDGNDASSKIASEWNGAIDL